MGMTMSLRRNTDQALPASHTIEIQFNLPADFPFGGVSNVPGIMMRQAEMERGESLGALGTQVADNLFLIALSALADFHNEGSLRPITVIAPLGSVLNCEYPATVGGSPVGYRIDDFASDLVDFLDAVGIPRAVLVGASSGGLVCQGGNLYVCSCSSGMEAAIRHIFLDRLLILCADVQTALDRLATGTA